MSTFNRFGDRNRDMQDFVERGVWGKQEWVDKAGSIIKVRGTGTVDEEVPVLNNGVGMHFPENMNTEVILVSSGSDTDLKHALLTIPRDKQRQWKENTGGVQDPLDPERALEFNRKRAYMDHTAFATRGGVFEVIDGKVYIRGELIVEKDIKTAGDFVSPNPPKTPPPTSGAPVTVPGFEE